MRNLDFTLKYDLVVSALIENQEGKVLMLFSKRVNNWSLPGGKVDTGENPIYAIVREVQEEVGLSVQPVRLIGAVDYNFSDHSYTINLLYKVNVVGGNLENKEPGKHLKMDYRDIKEIPDIFKALVPESQMS